MTSTIVTLTGPSCSGKSTIEGILKKRGFVNVVSTTTRPQRVGEVNGQSYYFVSRDAFDEQRSRGDFVESVEFNDYGYAVSKAEIKRVQAIGKPIVIVVEPHGLAQIQDYTDEQGIGVHSIFLGCPEAVIAERFLKRFTGDFVLGVLNDAAKFEKLIGTYASRLATMMTTERQWVEDADNSYLYDRIWPFADESNTDAIIKATLAAVGIELKAAA